VAYNNLYVNSFAKNVLNKLQIPEMRFMCF